MQGEWLGHKLQWNGRLFMLSLVINYTSGRSSPVWPKLKIVDFNTIAMNKLNMYSGAIAFINSIGNFLTPRLIY